MNRSELISSAAEKCGLSKKDTDKALAGILDAITESVKSDERVQIMGFGTFELRRRTARVGRDPRTKKEINIPASTSPAFKPGKNFKDAVSQH